MTWITLVTWINLTPNICMAKKDKYTQPQMLFLRWQYKTAGIFIFSIKTMLSKFSLSINTSHDHTWWTSRYRNISKQNISNSFSKFYLDWKRQKISSCCILSIFYVQLSLPQNDPGLWKAVWPRQQSLDWGKFIIISKGEEIISLAISMRESMIIYIDVSIC